jgi:hypothetical protein
MNVYIYNVQRLYYDNFLKDIRKANLHFITPYMAEGRITIYFEWKVDYK